MSEITPEKVEALRLSLEAEHARGLGGIVDSETVLAIIGAYQRLMGMALELSDKPRQAVVVEGTETPIVFDRSTFERRVNERFDEAVRKLGSESLGFMPATIAALRQQILSLDVDLAEASQAEQERAR